MNKIKLLDCCKDFLNSIQYRSSPHVLLGHTLEVEVLSEDIHRCAKCKTPLGSCPICCIDYGFPIMLFINEGKDGMIVLCMDCVNGHKLINEISCKTPFQR